MSGPETASRPRPPRPRLLGSLALAGYGHLLWPRWRELRNLAGRDAGRRPLRRLALGGLGALFMVAAFMGAEWLFSLFLQAEFLAELLIRRVTAIVLLFFTGLLLFSNLVTAFSTLYTAPDLPALVSAPVSIARLYLARLTLTWMQASWMMLIFALPILAAIGPVLGAPWWYYPSLPAALLPLTVCCAALGTMAAMVLARWLPIQRTREALLIVALFAFLVVYVAFRLAEPERFFEPDGFADLVALISNLRPDAVALTPPDWTTEIIFACARGEAGTIALTAGVSTSAAAATCVLGSWLARGVYLRGLMLAQEGRRRPASPTAGVGARRRGRWARPPRNLDRALSRRDTTLFFRTPAQWTQLLLVGALVLVYLLNFRYFRALSDSGVVGDRGLLAVNYALGGLVVTTLAARFIYPSVSLEGRAFWRIRAAPITFGQLLWSKARWGGRPLVLLAALMAAASDWIVELPWWMVAVSAALAAMTAWALAALAVGFGALDPRFDVDAPARLASGMGAVTFMLVGLAYIAVVGLLWILPVDVLSLYLDRGYMSRPSRIVQAVALVLGSGIVTYAVRRAAIGAGTRNLAALDR